MYIPTCCFCMRTGSSGVDLEQKLRMHVTCMAPAWIIEYRRSLLAVYALFMLFGNYY